jgi:ubiquinone/menaquinone biosynthesis C-methylase UbiE
MPEQEKFQLAGNAAQLYEAHKVAAIFRPLAEATLERVALGSDERLLDVACGTGILARLAAARLGPGAAVVGIDLNTAMIEVARAEMPAAGAKVTWHQGDVCALPFPDAAFDVAFCQQGLQFFPDKPGALREIRRVLAPNGRIALTVWRSVNPYFAALAAALKRHVSAALGVRALAPFDYRNADVIRSHLIEAGFKDIDIQGLVVTRRLGPAATAVPQEIASTPFAQEMATLDEDKRGQMIDDIAQAIEAYRAGEGFAIPQESHLVQARSG